MSIKFVKIEIQEFLALQSDKFISQISELQNFLGFDYNDGHFKEDVASIKFEYDVSSFDVVAYPLNKYFEVIGDIIIFSRDSKNDGFFPEEKEQILLNSLDEEERVVVDQELSEYKYGSFETWFVNCWVKSENPRKLKCFFSFHDTMWVTNLASGQKISEDKIPDLLK